MSIAETILSQIKAIDPRATWAWGVKKFINTGEGLQFKSSGMVKWKGYTHIKYNAGTDLYDIEFYRIRKYEKKVDNTVEGVFAEDLVAIVDAQVG